MAARNAKNRKNAKDLDAKNKETLELIAQTQEKIDQMELAIEDKDSKGVNTKGLKKERDEEVQQRIEEFDEQRNAKLAKIREEYMKRIQGSKKPDEKERLLEEMRRRTQAVEESLALERKEQEKNLIKALKARQKRNVKKDIKDMEKEVQEQKQIIKDLQNNMEKERAIAYAEDSNGEMLNEDLKTKVENLSKKVEDIEFVPEKTEEEKEVLELVKA